MKLRKLRTRQMTLNRHRPLWLRSWEFKDGYFTFHVEYVKAKQVRFGNLPDDFGLEPALTVGPEIVRLEDGRLIRG